VKYKNFNQYSEQYSRDANTFINKVAIATNENINFPYFNYIKNQYELKENLNKIPVIVADDYSFKSNALYESEFTYNLNKAPNFNMVIEDFSGAKFIPSYTRDIKTIKKLKFPIIAYNKLGEGVEYKTLGKLKASEGLYEKFREKVIPKTKFNILSFKGKPISIVESINKFPLDVDMNRFVHMKEATKISEELYEKYNLDFYNVELLESVKGGLYLNNVNRKLDLNPHQALTVYEAAYSDFYDSKLPNWVKNKMITESISKYYKTKLYDSMLIKSRHTLDYSKYN
jgi:hypothetical protein